MGKSSGLTPEQTLVLPGTGPQAATLAAHKISGELSGPFSRWASSPVIIVRGRIPGMAEKLDFVKQRKDLYQPKETPALVTVPAFEFLAVDGEGDPNTSEEYANAVGALYTMAYTLKFAVKKESGTDYGVLPLEGLWWADDWLDFTQANKANWKWTMMIRQPVAVTPEQFAGAQAKAKTKVGPVADHVRLVMVDEGESAQMLHRGPYADEAPNIARLHEFIEAAGRRPRDKHHEIYLTDPSRTKPDRMRTVLRQPVEPA
jgi:hypothetical protein